MVLAALSDAAYYYQYELSETLRPILEIGIENWLSKFFDEATGQHWNATNKIDDSYTVCLGDALYAIQKLIRKEVGLEEETCRRLNKLSEKIISWSFKNLLLPNGHFCERKLHFIKYSVKSIRSFDGLIGDALSLYLLNEEQNNKNL